MESGLVTRNGPVPKELAQINNSKIPTNNCNKKYLEDVKDLGFCYVGNSMLTIWRRPGKSQLKDLLFAMKGITMIITC